jgi:hypothetical protein
MTEHIDSWKVHGANISFEKHVRGNVTIDMATL